MVQGSHAPRPHYALSQGVQIDLPQAGLPRCTGVDMRKDRRKYERRAWACRYNFSAREEEVAILERVTHEELLEAYRMYLLPTSAKRRRLAVHVIGRKVSAELHSSVASPGVTLVTNPDCLRGELPTYEPLQGHLPPVEQCAR